MTNLVSVVMPVNNGGAFLQQAVDSILQQSHVHLELIIVDDHSDDGAVKALSQLDSRVKRIKSAGKGVVSAFNNGFECSTGDFIARMDADDLALPQRLQVQLEYFQQNPSVDIVSCCVEFFGAETVLGGLKRYQKWLNSVRSPHQIHQQIFIESPMPNPGAIFRRKALEQLGGYRQMQWPEDYDLYLRADAAGMRMGKPGSVLLHWREHEGRLTHTDDVYSREQFMRAKAYFLVNHRLRQVIRPEQRSSGQTGPDLSNIAPSTAGEPPIIWGAGPTGRLMHDLIIEQGGQIGGFIDVHPRRIGGHKRGLPVWSIEKAAELHVPMVLVAVGAAGARKKIAEFMSQNNKAEGMDYLFVA